MYTYYLKLSGGNVGIGTANPGEKLEVYNGAIKIFKSVTAPAATWTDIDSDSTYIGAMYTVTVVQDADAANIRTYFVLLSGSFSGTTAVVVNSVAAGTSTITASFQGSGSGAGPYKLQINPSVAATAYVGKIVVL